MDNKPIRLVVTDLDGTLLSPKREISQEAVEVIGELRQRGVPFTFITGRPPYAVDRFIQRAGITGPVAGCNGGIIFEGARILSKHSFPLAPLGPMLEEAAQAGLTVIFYGEGTEYCLQETDWTKKRSLPLCPLKEAVEKTTEKVNIITEDEAAFQTLLPQISALSSDYSISVYGFTGCEIVAKEVDKAMALAELCRFYSVPIEEALAIGDNENDNAMLRAAGVGAAVANAVESTKQAADYHCQSSYTDGVVEAVRHFVLEV